MPVSKAELQAVPRQVWLAVLVAALGYFVDIYDLLLFSIVRVQSLKDLGFAEDEVLAKGVILINTQMAGLLIGGLIWGVLGDKRGRLSVLLGSIVMYSIANFLNGFVQNIEQYAILRFIAGVGLAGELGAGITLISEILPRNIRGLGTTIIATVGILGAVVGALLGEVLSWRTCYIIGGVMGFAILLLRVGVTESGLFESLKNEKRDRGNILMLIRRRATFLKFLYCILIGVPIWYVVSVLFTLAPEFGKAFGMVELPTGGQAVMWGYIGLAIGDLSSGLVSQAMRSRRRAILFYILLTIFGVAVHLVLPHSSLSSFYATCCLMGVGAGYWAMFVQVAAEQFGTNIRATVTTSVPNFVRAATIPQTLGFKALIPTAGVIGSAVVIGVVSFVVALLSLWKLDETFHKDLDFHE
ncbi:MAG: MFS transporter [Bdellovibrionales bacterium]|nr:MFS transporter [Bdellovibrionales bacterium]